MVIKTECVRNLSGVVVNGQIGGGCVCAVSLQNDFDGMMTCFPIFFVIALTFYSRDDELGHYLASSCNKLQMN